MTTKEQNPGTSKIDKTTLVPLSHLAAIVLSAVTMTSWIRGTLLEIKYDAEIRSVQTINAINECMARIEKINQAVNTLTTEKWTVMDMKVWIEELKTRNPEIHVPPATRN